MSDNYFDNIAPALKAMSKTFEQYREMSKKISESLIQSMVELQKQISTIMAPLAEFQKRLPEMLAPLAKVSAQVRAVSKLGENQLIWFNVLDEDLVTKILDFDDVENIITEYLELTNYSDIDEIIRVSRKTCFLKEKKLIYSQPINAYRNKHYNLACIAFIAIIDFLLSKVSGDSTTKFLKKIEKVVERINSEEFLENLEMNYFCVFLSVDKTLNSLCAYSDFTKEEPQNLNRHWIAHGRTQKQYTKLDCIKLINVIYALLLIESFKGGETDD